MDTPIPIAVLVEKFSFQREGGTGRVALIGEGGITYNAVEFQMRSQLILTPQAARDLLLNLNSLRAILEQASVPSSTPDPM